MNGLPPHLSRQDQTQLWRAVHEGDDVEARRILEPLVAEPDTDVCQFRRITALHVASRRGWSDLVHRLIAAGADVNMSSIGGQGDLVGETPLQEACLHGHLSICEALIEAGADVNACQAVLRLRGMVRGALAIASEAGHLPIVSRLLEAGADPDGTPPGESCDFDPDEISLIRPLPASIENGHASVAEMLLNAGADPDLESAQGSPFEPRTCARQLIADSDDPDIRALI